MVAALKSMGISTPHFPTRKGEHYLRVHLNKHRPDIKAYLSKHGDVLLDDICEFQGLVWSYGFPVWGDRQLLHLSIGRLEIPINRYISWLCGLSLNPKAYPRIQIFRSWLNRPLLLVNLTGLAATPIPLLERFTTALVAADPIHDRYLKAVIHSLGVYGKVDDEYSLKVALAALGDPSACITKGDWWLISKKVARKLHHKDNPTTLRVVGQILREKGGDIDLPQALSHAQFVWHSFRHEGISDEVFLEAWDSDPAHATELAKSFRS